ncbi:MAG: PAS domain-containing protein [Rhodocyclaceae bacterium]|nr:PAS domain-containing protein [Rhodocyclaceae bacterium]
MDSLEHLDLRWLSAGMTAILCLVAGSLLVPDSALGLTLGAAAALGLALALVIVVNHRLARLAGPPPTLAGIRHEIERLNRELVCRTAKLSASEARLGLLMDQSADGLWDWEPGTDNWYFSPRVRELLGHADTEGFFQDFQLWQGIHPDDHERVLAARDECLLGRAESLDQDCRLRCREGYRWFRCRAGIARDPDGKIRHFGGSLSDIGARKQLECDLWLSQERQASTLQALSEGLWDWDLEEARFHYSRRFQDMLGYPEEELPQDQEAFLALVHADDRTRVRVEWSRHFAERLPYDSEHRLRLSNGDYHWFRTRGQAVWDAEGHVLRFSAAVTDITLHRHALESIRTLLAENQALLENALVGIAQVRGQTVFSCNHRFEEMFGYGYGEVSDKSMDLFFPTAAEAERVRGIAYPAMARGEHFSMETELRRKNGASLWCLLSAHAAMPEQPDNGCIWVFADLSQQKRAMDALRHERDFSNALIGHLPGLFCLLDDHRRIVRWNTNFEAQTGFSAREILQLTWDQLFTDEVRPAAEQLMQEAWGSGAASRQIPLKNKFAQLNPYLFTCVRVEVDNEENLALLGLDVTEREQVAQRIREINENLEQRVKSRTTELEIANKELESFSYSVSHDLSTPLRGIDGFSHLLEQDYASQLDELGRNYIQRIRNAARRMQQLIDDLLSLSRVSRDDMQKDRCNLAQIARTILSDLHYQEPHRAVQETIPDSIVVMGDPNLLTIAMENLLRNAWKFSSGHKDTHIRVGAVDKEGEHVYFVADNGAGFDMKHTAQLFGPFQRLHHPSEFEGTGIGLAIVSRIIQRHGGRIWAEAEVEKGATFYFTLP